MPTPPSIDEILASVSGGGIKKWEMERDPLSGAVTKFKTDGTAADNAAAQAALQLILATPPAQSAGSTAAPNPAVSNVKAIGLGEAARKYLLTLDAATMPAKTLGQKRAAVNGFARWKGEAHILAQTGRTDVAEWLQSLRNGNLSTPTLSNKASYLTAFYTWAQGAGYYPSGDNPATKHIRYSTREKRQRRKLGFRPFTLDEVQRLYAPGALRTLNEQTRWGAVLGLYLGARVSEVGQIALEDFSDRDGLWCVSITDEGEGQSVKNEGSRRTLPIHPDLLTLGLRDYVNRLRVAGETQLFPRAKIGSVNGMGNWLSKAYSRHIIACAAGGQARGKVGFHSLRKTVIQTLMAAGVVSEARAQYVGHELDDEHHATYGRFLTMPELLHGTGAGAVKTAGIAALSFGLDLNALMRVL